MTSLPTCGPGTYSSGLRSPSSVGSSPIIDTLSIQPRTDHVVVYGAGPVENGDAPFLEAVYRFVGLAVGDVGQRDAVVSRRGSKLAAWARKSPGSMVYGALFAGRNGTDSNSVGDRERMSRCTAVVVGRRDIAATVAEMTSALDCNRTPVRYCRHERTPRSPQQSTTHRRVDPRLRRRPLHPSGGRCRPRGYGPSPPDGLRRLARDELILAGFGSGAVPTLLPRGQRLLEAARGKPLQQTPLALTSDCCRWRLVAPTQFRWNACDG